MSKKSDTWYKQPKPEGNWAKQKPNTVPTRECGEDIRQRPKKKEKADG